MDIGGVPVIRVRNDTQNVIRTMNTQLERTARYDIFGPRPGVAVFLDRLSATTRKN